MRLLLKYISYFVRASVQSVLFNVYMSHMFICFNVV